VEAKTEAEAEGQRRAGGARNLACAAEPWALRLPRCAACAHARYSTDAAAHLACPCVSQDRCRRRPAWQPLLRCLSWRGPGLCLLLSSGWVGWVG